MFSLVITIISIALVAVLALATLYYGGSAFTSGGDAAQAAQALNTMQQIQGADTLYKAATGAGATSIGELVAADYLRAVPGSLALVEGHAVIVGLSDSACLAANAQLGYTSPTIPLCSDPAIAGQQLCCSSPD